jgi:O-acetyl-ADP-ribose deacetylase (regulator of RNase III)
MRNSMKIIYKQGDLLKCEEEILVHGCNCKGVMGAGVAKAIREKYPIVFKRYKSFCNSSFTRGYTPKDLLGIVQPVKCPDGKVVANAFTQENYGRESGVIYVSYPAVRKVFQYLNSQKHHGQIALPKIGSQLAGGDWATIEKIIEEEMTDVQPVVYVL